MMIIEQGVLLHFFFWYSASIGSYCSGEVCTNLYMCSSQEQAMYCFLTWLCFVQVIKAQHSHQGRGGATIQVVILFHRLFAAAIGVSCFTNTI